MDAGYARVFKRFFYKKPRSLKKSLTVVLLLSTVVPIVLMGIGSYYVIYSILDNKIANGVQSTLRQVRSNIEKTYANLNYVSQQLSSNDLQLYFQSEDTMERYMLSQTVFKTLDLVNFTNPDTGLFYYYTQPGNDIYFQNQSVLPNQGVEQLPELSYVKGVAFYGPHASLSGRSGYVFSLSRPINIPKRSNVYSYVETNNELYGRLLNSEQYGLKMFHLLADAKGKVVFSQDETVFPGGTVLPVDFGGREYTQANGYYMFREYSEEQGWFVYSLVDQQAFRAEMKSWLLISMMIAVVSLLFSGVLGWSIWKMVYKPLAKLNGEIHKVKASRSHEDVPNGRKIVLTRISEFDEVLLQFQDMRVRISMLLTELMQKEEDKRYLEVEKLVAQINPHFLYNTLNTVQWLAKSNGQEEIVNLIAVFTRLMRYNLGKEGGLVKLSNEIDALKDYVKLQQIRYNYEFTVDIHADPAALDVPVPRFLLQPLIENALYHGQSEAGSSIRLSITIVENGSILVQVQDNGPGISEEQIEKLFRQIPEREKVGMGIGLSYVNTMLRMHYGEEARLQVESRPHEGTTIRFLIPMRLKEA
ncbi:cache domain-containing sensor histidine kinase [Paenibacillus contaminans]|uniref:histidine kinase n=1 Tax=Paenibacillus contaminans TaxID=450362 RepID=A0A329MKZ0_9BACL|nr:histidine kinase [Paenibacillus contaminans]RAV20454.1 sensor histidine kinase [Paenibacillus contaminans]